MKDEDLEMNEQCHKDKLVGEYKGILPTQK